MFFSFRICSFHSVLSMEASGVSCFACHSFPSNSQLVGNQNCVLATVFLCIKSFSYWRLDATVYGLRYSVFCFLIYQGLWAYLNWDSINPIPLIDVIHIWILIHFLGVDIYNVCQYVVSVVFHMSCYLLLLSDSIM